jgi:hypothetical protein
MISSNLGDMTESDFATSAFEILFEIPRGGKHRFCAGFPDENW